MIKANLIRPQVGRYINYRDWVCRIVHVGDSLSRFAGGSGVYETTLEFIRIGPATVLELERMNNGESDGQDS